jgi:motility quorum-sensing regulator / GCU-specific mRNA interferase toxin
MTMTPRKSTYDLDEIKALVRSGCWRHTTSALNDAMHDFDFSQKDVLDIILTLTEGDLYKTMPSEKMPDLWQDVYHKSIEGIPAYIKLQIVVDKSARKVIIISFKRK